MTILALYTHRMILLNEHYGLGDLYKRQEASVRKPPMISFILVSVIGLVVFMALLGIFTYLLYILIGEIALKDRGHILLSVLIALMPAIIVYGVLLSLFGTVFPAAAIGGDRSLKAAWKRGKSSFWKTLGRLIVGPLAFVLFGGGGVGFLTYYLAKSGIDVESASVNIPLSVLAYSINVCGILLSVSALSMAYQSAEARTEERDTNHET